MYFKDQVMDINRNNYENFLLLYLDRELNPADRQAVEKFLNENTDLQKEFALLGQTVFTPSDLVFDHKESLLRKEEKRKIIPLYGLRRAAAIAVLLLSSWYIISQITTHRAKDLSPTKQATASQPVKDIPATVIADPSNHAAPDPVKGKEIAEKNMASARKTNIEQASIKATEKMVNATASANYNKAQGTKPVTPQHPESVHQDNRTEVNSLVAEEALTAVQKSSTALEIQSAGMQPAGVTEHQASLNGVKAPALVLSTAAVKDQISYENAVMGEVDLQNENAISVIALNNQNKGITGFFKKLTRSAPADDNERKVRVSVFQFSY